MPNVALFVGFVTATREARRKYGDIKAPTIVHCRFVKLHVFKVVFSVKLYLFQLFFRSNKAAYNCMSSKSKESIKFESKYMLAVAAKGVRWTSGWLLGTGEGK